jgi:ankyrin repeat protein
MTAAAAAGSVHAAVAAGKSREEVRLVIDGFSQGDEQRLAVNQPAGQDDNKETPLKAAHRLGRGDLVGLLLEAGADASKLFAGGRAVTAIALCVAYGQAESLRALLKAAHDAKQKLNYAPYGSLAGAEHPSCVCTAAHLCVAPPRLSSDDDDEGPLPPPQLECLEVIAQEGKADINAVDEHDFTPLHWLAAYAPPGDAHLLALDLLVRLGADVRARDSRHEGALVFTYVRRGYLAGLKRLLGHGASADVVSADSVTPLMHACSHALDAGTDHRDVALELLRASSRETRQVRDEFRRSAIDYIFLGRDGQPLDRCKQLIGELLSGVAPLAVLLAARAADRGRARRAARAGGGRAALVRGAQLARARRPGGPGAGHGGAARGQGGGGEEAVARGGPGAAARRAGGRDREQQRRREWRRGRAQGGAGGGLLPAAALGRAASARVPGGAVKTLLHIIRGRHSIQLVV